VINLVLRHLHDLHQQTALLEALNWDEELTSEFVDELNAMLMAAPSNVEKALFWLRNTPWECFNDKPIPPEVYNVVRDIIYQKQKQIYNEMKQQEILDKDGGWN
jgi:hypothetical protein